MFYKNSVIFRIFLKSILAYEKNPEYVGYCFIEWIETLRELYAEYCLNQDENSYLIFLPEADKMFTVTSFF